MAQISFLDSLTAPGIVVVVLFAVLIIILLIKNNADTPINKGDTSILSEAEATIPPKIIDDVESKTVAMLMALILLNGDKNNKNYQITSIERIK